MSYHELNLEERITIRMGLLQSLSLREIARQINRSPSTVSREVRCNSDANGICTVYDAEQKRKARRLACCPKRKLLPDSELFEPVKEMLRDHFSPEQIAGNLHSMFPKLKDTCACHETIYNVIYALPVEGVDPLATPRQERTQAALRRCCATQSDPEYGQYSFTPT